MLKILSDPNQVQKGVALKVPLAELTESKGKGLVAFNRATRKSGRSVATASDDTFLYVGTRNVVANGLRLGALQEVEGIANCADPDRVASRGIC